MSGIKGSKSKFYIKEPLPGIENSSDTLINVTTGELPGARIGLDVIQHGVYEVNNTGIIGVGSAQRIIECINHGASAGDVMKITSGNSLDAEIAIVGVIDADNFVIAYEENLSVGDTFSVLRYVSAKYSQDGSLQVSSGPIQFTKNGSAELVVEDTVTMANNKPMPGGMYIKKDDGSWYPVTLDTSNPYAHTPIPVAITDVTGTSNVNVDLSGSSLSVNIKHDGASPSSIRIGDGTTLTSVTVNNELKVKDADVKTALDTLNTVDFATEAKQDTTITAIGSLLTELQLKADLTETQPVSVQSSALPTGAATETTLSALNTKVPANLTVASTRLLVDGSGVTQPISATALPLPTGAATEAKQDTMIASLASIAGEDFATEVTLAAMSAKLPATLGQKTSANSLAVVLPSDQVVATRESALSCGTYTDTTISGATVTTILAPVGARGMKIQAGINNTADLLVGLGGVTPDNTINVGLEFQGGRSEDIVGASNVEVTSADPLATNQKIVIVWSYV